MDTGADKSVLMPLDAGRFGLDYSKLGATVESTGIGGIAKDFVEPALLAFVGSSLSVYVYAIGIHITSPTPDIAKIPSLLGRDIMNHWTTIFDPQNSLLQARVIYADQTFPLSAAQSAPPSPKP